MTNLVIFTRKYKNQKLQDNYPERGRTATLPVYEISWNNYGARIYVEKKRRVRKRIHR